MKRLLLLPLFFSCTCGDKPIDVTEDSGTPPPPPGTVALEISPSTAEIIIDGLTPGTQQFLVEAIDEDGGRTDVTDRAVLTVANPDLGSLVGGLFTTELIGGETTVEALLGTFTAVATVRVSVERTVVVVDPNNPVPVDVVDLFDGATEDPSRAPTLVYPNDGVLLPRNLGSVEIHYRPGTDNDLFEISFASPAATLTVYTRCVGLGGGCVYAPEPAVYAALADSNAGGDKVEVRLRGTDDAAASFGAADPVDLHFSARNVDGGLYYWTTDGGRIMRVDFGSGQMPEQFYPFDDRTTCYGCHSISRNGQRMTLSRNGQRDGRLTILEIAGQQTLLQDEDDKREQFQSWDPTSTKFAGVWSDGPQPDTDIRIRDGQTGDVIETIDLDVEPDHPDWSPAGDRILFTLVTRHQTSQRPGRGGIAYVEQTGNGWSDPVELIAPEDELNRYYPAYSPDAAFFLYCESRCPPGEIYDGSCDADADPSAKLWSMSSEGGPAIYLAHASGPGIEDNGETDLSNTFPRWAPFVDPLRADGSGRVMWFTFSSRRAYGLRSPNGSDQWLWMAAIDPDAIARGEDGSFPAFALPFQDLGTSNHIAQWTTTIVPTTPNPGDGGIDPPGDGGTCISTGDPCDPMNDNCCAGTVCTAQGGGIFICRPNL